MVPMSSDGEPTFRIPGHSRGGHTPALPLARGPAPPRQRAAAAVILTGGAGEPAFRRPGPGSGREVAGRPGKPLGPDGRPAAELASELRRMRELSGLTYSQLAAKTGKAVSTLTAAVAGERLPSWPVARAWAQACGGDGDTVLGLYQRGCVAAGRSAPARDLAGVVPPDPAAATTAAGFITQMIRLRARAGISLRTLNRRSGGRLPPSTVSEALRRDRLPRLELVLDYARACGIRGDTIGEWERSWNAITNALRPGLAEGQVAQGSHSAARARHGLARPGPDVSERR